MQAIALAASAVHVAISSYIARAFGPSNNRSSEQFRATPAATWGAWGRLGARDLPQSPFGTPSIETRTDLRERNTSASGSAIDQLIRQSRGVNRSTAFYPQPLGWRRLRWVTCRRKDICGTVGTLRLVTSRASPGTPLSAHGAREPRDRAPLVRHLAPADDRSAAGQGHR